jgi:site-specific DNA recombinase
MGESAIRTVTYSRNSSAKQKSINDQKADNRRVCEAGGWSVVAELDDPSSASRYATKVRQNWARLLELLPDVDMVVLWEPSRGDRSLTSWAGFLDACRTHKVRTHKVRIHAVSHQTTYDPANPRHYRSLAEDGVDSAYESDKTSQRVRRGQAAAAVAGRPHGTVTYGYLRRYDPVTRAFVEQVEHPEHAAVVREVFAALASGEPMTSLSKRLTRDGVASPQGGPRWYHPTLRFMATNAAYRGVRVHDGQEYPAVWPALVDDTTWQAVQRVLGTNTQEKAIRKNAAPGAVKYLLSGAMRVMTAPCGNQLTGVGDLPGRAAHYVCSLDACVSGSMRECDEYVTRLVVARLCRKDARGLWVTDDTAARAAADEMARLTAELEEARASFAGPNGISAAAMAAKEKGMGPAIADAQRRARPSGVPLAMLELLDAADFGHDRVRPCWDRMALPAKREIIAGIFSNLILGQANKRVSRWTTADERMNITAQRIQSTWRAPLALAA